VIAIIGVGKMGEALLAGLVAEAQSPAEIVVTEPRPEQSERIRSAYGVEAVGTDEAVKRAETVILALKPQDMGDLLREIAPLVRHDQLLISVAAGIATTTVERHLEAAGTAAPVVRAMPNTPALLGVGMTVIAAGSRATTEHLDRAQGLLECVGRVERVAEHHMDTVTALSGSGPAYFYLVAESMIETAVMMGLPRRLAETMVVQTITGAAAMLRDSDESPEALRHAVTSPGGTTAAALRELERSGVRSALTDAIEAARDRSRELSGG
jgi:pyrroline-5-carboxylate reductase